MSWFSSQWMMVPFGGVVVVACLVADPVTSNPNGFNDEWSAPPDSPLTIRRNELDAIRRATAARMALKNRLLEELIAERMTLREVADSFTELNEMCPTYASMIHRTMPGHTAEERMARNVLEHLRGYPLLPERRAAVFARLGQQFQDQFGYPFE